MTVLAQTVPYKTLLCLTHGQLWYRPLQLWTQLLIRRAQGYLESYRNDESFINSPYMQPEDTLSRARQLDTSTLGQIHDQYYPEVFRYVRYRLDDEQACEDIAAEVFLRLLDALHRKRGPKSNLPGWLFATASNMVNDHFRKQYARKEASLEEDLLKLAGDNQPEEMMEEASLHNQVRRAISQLTLEQQHVLGLRFAGEHSLEETANIMGKSVVAVKALQFRAVASLKRLLIKKKNETE